MYSHLFLLLKLLLILSLLKLIKVCSLLRHTIRGKSTIIAAQYSRRKHSNRGTLTDIWRLQVHSSWLQNFYFMFHNNQRKSDICFGKFISIKETLKFIFQFLRKVNYITKVIFTSENSGSPETGHSNWLLYPTICLQEKLIAQFHHLK